MKRLTAASGRFIQFGFQPMYRFSAWVGKLSLRITSPAACRCAPATRGLVLPYREDPQLREDTQAIEMWQVPRLLPPASTIELDALSPGIR